MDDNKNTSMTNFNGSSLLRDSKSSQMSDCKKKPEINVNVNNKFEMNKFMRNKYPDMSLRVKANSGHHR